MNNHKLLIYLSNIGIKVDELSPSLYKGHSCNVLQWHSFRIWINKSNKVTIKALGVQRSFKITTQRELEKELAGFELI